MNRLVAAALAALLLAAAPAGATVFWRLGRTQAGLIPDTDLSYRHAFAANLTVNQGHGRLEVWGTARGPGEVLGDLRAKAQAAGAKILIGEGGALAWAVAVTPDGRIHRILISAAEGRYSHLFQLSQDAADFQRSLAPPARLPLDLPEIPGSRILSYLANDDSATAVASLGAAGDAIAARAPIAASLAAEGWERLPAGGGDAAVFVRKGELLLVSVKRAGADGGALITIAHKRLKDSSRL